MLCTKCCWALLFIQLLYFFSPLTGSSGSSAEWTVRGSESCCSIPGSFQSICVWVWYATQSPAGSWFHIQIWKTRYNLKLFTQPPLQNRAYYEQNWSSIPFIHSFIHSVVCLTTGPKPLPKRALHIVRSRASSFKWEYPLPSFRSSRSFLRLLRLPVTSILPSVFPSITRCRMQFLRKRWPIQLAFLLLISCRIFLCSLTLSYTSSFLAWSVQLLFSILLQHHISKLSRCFWSTARSFQHHIKLCSKCSTSLASSSVPSQMCY